MNYTTYDPTTGEITGVISTSDVAMAELNLAGKSYITGSYSGDEYYIINNVPVAKSANPSSGTLKYLFDYTTKNWVVEPTLTTHSVRKQRNQLLYDIDKINSVWYSTLNDQQKSDLLAYRQALLDVPQQSGFPITIIWPSKPEWL